MLVAMRTPYIAQAARGGFSIIELMMVLTIASILMALAVPGMQATIARQKLTTAASDLYGAVTLARTEAIRRGTRIDLKASSAGWAGGWTVSVPTTGAQEILYSHAAVPKGVLVEQPSFGNSLSYDGTGRTRQAANSQVTVAGEWVIKLAASAGGGVQERRLQVNRLGRPLLCNPVMSSAC